LESSTDQFHVAVDGRVVGFVATNGSELVKLFVSADVRGSGIAAALLSHGERQISECGISEAVLFCTAGNTRAQRFYNREGWTLCETFPDKLWLPEKVNQEFVVATHRYEKHLD
jgi:ribosomal protein S18 acetylase RimI-like enzyme